MLKKGNNYSTLFLSVIFIAGIYFYVVNYFEFDLLDWIELIGLSKLLFALLIYLTAHFIRGIRLVVMMGNSDISLRTVIATQYLTNGMNLIFPFKLGELIRLYKFHKIIKRYKISFSIVILEKLIDFFFLFSGLLLVYSLLDKGNPYIHFTLIICGGVAFILLLLMVLLPSNIKTFNLFLAKRYTDKYSLAIISICSKVCVIISVIKKLLSQKITTIGLLTVLIWSLEISVFLFLVSYVSSYKLIVLLALLVFMADFIPSGTMGLGGIQLAFYLIYLIQPDFAYLELSVIYQLFIFMPAIILSWGVFIIQSFIEKRNKIHSTFNKSTSIDSPITFRIWMNRMASFFKI